MQPAVSIARLLTVWLLLMSTSTADATASANVQSNPLCRFEQLCRNLSKSQDRKEKYEIACAIRKELASSKNWPFRGLYWLSKDLFTPEFQDVMEPDARELYAIRTY